MLTVNLSVRRGGLYRRDFTTVYLRARGLGVMMSPSHGEDREFKSLRAHLGGSLLAVYSVTKSIWPFKRSFYSHFSNLGQPKL